ncbi:MAG: 2,5-diamino-6-(ribosylamino)-4(3H)-pyrimidinone 5'-phosphate reductase [Candidatus Poseidoniia archaeon]|jgi:2,5-diamino-6-(ribosylamino)-4(3H)-pyrimidinone 5'-phosphate reductase|nr:2,5-diamino-6-(ribosylamino)-4(3H)-pyrimidinone 5'-phosphate reductase [Euryarchaeota archaeon]MDP7136309.1 2,5-diamino-6-(ribosylamino)-4(3H)-pyrimidinone 5'-phosphate reductase [Candidatus Poseidoniia archaeon]MDP7535813.1 2,5-diamino-6-(ribosylamino)-4(3H)-pyrimidinone 5'-phosphate reductase [Candidatus Poseidoniia archaeon]MDP7590437.1 2,5-diamino-6-(ribosylamino)-4(3H)-pyrimidinone 5'-phosphate reductase [Candidatus Poseidoniia archaeon]MDP7607640.1 2,5-diamino-6-(ribosylamino)-4(3H)-py|tara:strand:- start:2453 stop:3091 length:639 start_codon:yes stop_codon:yes gene_type:complete
MERPHVIVNCAASLDGKIALANRRPVRLSCDADHRRVHTLRAECDAVIVGIGTVLQDDPRLLLDPALAPGASPLRVVLDTTLRTPRSARVLQGDASTLVATGSRPRRQELRGAEVVACGNGAVDLARLLALLHARGVRKVLVEGGETVLWSFLTSGLWDEFTQFVANTLIGGVTSPTVAGGAGAATPAEMHAFTLESAERLGDGVLLTWRRG